MTPVAGPGNPKPNVAVEFQVKLETNLASHWEGVRLPPSFWKVPGLSEGPKGGRRKGGRGRKLSHFSFCCAFRCCVVYSPCFPVWGEEKVMTIYDAGPLAADPLCGLLRLPRNFPQLPRKFFGDFPGSSPTVELNSFSPRVPRKFPRLPRKFPGRFPDVPRRSPLFLGSLTPSLDSQKLPLVKRDRAALGCRSATLLRVALRWATNLLEAHSENPS